MIICSSTVSCIPSVGCKKEFPVFIDSIPLCAIKLKSKRAAMCMAELMKISDNFSNYLLEYKFEIKMNCVINASILSRYDVYLNCKYSKCHLYSFVHHMMMINYVSTEIFISLLVEISDIFESLLVKSSKSIIGDFDILKNGIADININDISMFELFDDLYFTYDKFNSVTSLNSRVFCNNFNDVDCKLNLSRASECIYKLKQLSSNFTDYLLNDNVELNDFCAIVIDVDLMNRYQEYYKNMYSECQLYAAVKDMIGVNYLYTFGFIKLLIDVSDIFVNLSVNINGDLLLDFQSLFNQFASHFKSSFNVDNRDSDKAIDFNSPDNSPAKQIDVEFDYDFLDEVRRDLFNGTRKNSDGYSTDISSVDASCSYSWGFIVKSLNLSIEIDNTLKSFVMNLLSRLTDFGSLEKFGIYCLDDFNSDIHIECDVNSKFVLDTKYGIFDISEFLDLYLITKDVHSLISSLLNDRVSDDLRDDSVCSPFMRLMLFDYMEHLSKTCSNGVKCVSFKCENNINCANKGCSKTFLQYVQSIVIMGGI